MTQQMKPSTSAGGGRQLLEQAIECLIALLDLQEVDAEKEPTLGWPNPARHVPGGTDQSSLWPEAQDGENEPSLGWNEMEARWGRYDEWATAELEEEHNGSEPSLGWQNEGSQKRLRTSRNDCEEQCEDEGAQDDREPDVDAEPDYRRPPKGYMQPEDLRQLAYPPAGLKEAQS